MRFSLALVSSALLAQLALAAPASQSNMAIPEGDFKSAQVTPLKVQENFSVFHWKKEDGEDATIDRVFSFELNEPAQLQITDYLKSKH
ncbi:hypothetical protein BCV72DRAFT_54637 [Rhizopus microsporus var. microsporus]|uniref:Uncharacterized protein n=1 Tax=Rhizopus microsporus var. microsporus TaxID=86635 RepID=A0A1X0QRE6_RHIZD|nr:hypothetical protein BCV72DRAFT_54637 [Rhizopus microsporus var. microsporus]